ncbi:MAG: hypothetical protein R3D25_21525 [Geminicoccaceae bacterium]
MPEAESWLEEQHGRIAGGSFCVLGLGKLGSRELSLGSDLDLVFIFEAPEDMESDGAKPCAATPYYARLGQRLVGAINPDGRGPALRDRHPPPGHPAMLGPIALQPRQFPPLRETTAQVWERQSLTRARVVAGEPGLAADVTSAIDEALARPVEPEHLAREVRAMRLRIFKEHGSDNPWNLKHCQGGLDDLEFAAQYLVLRHGPRTRACGAPTRAASSRQPSRPG